MKRVRLWICYKCRVVYRRKKKEVRSYHCPKCSKEMVKSRKWPSSEFWRLKRIGDTRESNQKEKLDRKISVPRDSHGKVLKVTKELKKIWKGIERIKQVPAFRRRAEKFIKELHTNCIHRLGVNGLVEPPKIEITPKRFFEHGSYNVSLFKGVYKIEIGRDNLEQMRATFLHEVQHHIDYQIDDKRGYKRILKERLHDHTWKSRVSRFKKMIRVKSEFVLNN